MIEKLKYWLNIWSSPEGYTATDCSALKIANAELAAESNRFREGLAEALGEGINGRNVDRLQSLFLDRVPRGRDRNLDLAVDYLQNGVVPHGEVAKRRVSAYLHERGEYLKGLISDNTEDVGASRPKPQPTKQ